jgi:hypothetical protein
MADNRSDADKLAGVIPVRWSDSNGRGTVRKVPTLKRRAAREWKEALASKFGTVGTLDVSEMSAIGGALNVGSDVVADLVMSYDVTGALGDRDHIEEHIDDSQLYDALRAMLEVSFPFVSDLRSALGELRGLLVQPNSTSSPLPIGTSTPTPSTPD